jgi:hypothetical protein
MPERKTRTLEPLRRVAKAQAQQPMSEVRADNPLVQRLSMFKHKISQEAVNESLWGHPEGPPQLRKG